MGRTTRRHVSAVLAVLTAAAFLAVIQLAPPAAAVGNFERLQLLNPTGINDNLAFGNDGTDNAAHLTALANLDQSDAT